MMPVNGHKLTQSSTQQSTKLNKIKHLGSICSSLIRDHEPQHQLKNLNESKDVDQWDMQDCAGFGGKMPGCVKRLARS
jgi:hypothetical protein